MEWPLVLCVDDDPDISRTIEMRLNCFEVRMLHACQGTRGRWLAAVEKPDVIITDLRMPHADGECFVTCLKRNADTAHIPVIVLTGRRGDDLCAPLEHFEMERLLTKPIHFDLLCVELRRRIRLRERTREAEAAPEDPMLLAQVYSDACKTEFEC
jgi:response regulator RpfG family c-di-GMP phosphodiesterase